MENAARRSLAPLLLLWLVLLAWWAWSTGRIDVPDDWNPWAPLDVAATPNLLTGYKLRRASGDRARCQQALAAATLQMTALDDRTTAPGCGFDNAVRIHRTSVAVSEPFALSCRAALSLALWEHNELQQAALLHVSSRVERIEHVGSYACRNLYGRDGAARSRHATADAIDITGFVLADGRRVRVLAAWSATDRGDQTAIDESRFLHALRDGACRYFDAVLGPDYNAAHADHLHFDRGRARVCR